MSYEQPKIERLLRLMELMSGGVDYTIDELKNKLGMSERTMYRYIESFRDAGFSVSRRTNVPKLISVNRRNLDINRFVFFSPEEAYVLDSLIDRLDQTNVLKGNLKKKLEAVCEQTPVSNFIDNKDLAKKIEALSKAISIKKKVILHDYESGVLLTTSDRLVEPFEFSTNCIDVWAYEEKSGLCKLYKISRIKSVEITEQDWENEPLHKTHEMDIFRMSSDFSEHVKIRLTALAKNILLEEYPLSEQYITETPAPEYDSKLLWTLETDVRSVFGVGRFVMGLVADVEVVEGDKLKEYLKLMTENFFIPEFIDTLPHA